MQSFVYRDIGDYTSWLIKKFSYYYVAVTTLAIMFVYYSEPKEYLIKASWFYNITEFSKYPIYTNYLGFSGLIIIFPFSFYCTVLGVKVQIIEEPKQPRSLRLFGAIFLLLCSLLTLIFAGGGGEGGKYSNAYLGSMLGLIAGNYCIWMVLIFLYNLILMDLMKRYM